MSGLCAFWRQNVAALVGWVRPKAVTQRPGGYLALGFASLYPAYVAAHLVSDRPSHKKSPH